SDFVKEKQTDGHYVALNLVASGLLPENAADIPPGILNNSEASSPSGLNDIRQASEAIKQMLIWNRSQGNTDLQTMKRVFKAFDADLGCDAEYIRYDKACVVDTDGDQIG
ncbi:hypothetical protein, partial [Veronia pacifica]